MEERLTEQQIAVEEETADTQVGYTLLFGLWASIAVMLLGLILAAAKGGSASTRVLPLDQVLPQLVKGDPAAVLDLGILLLFATPLIGVLVALVQFVRHRDQPFVLITALLVVILAIGFAVALR